MGYATGLRREIEERRACLVGARDDLVAIQNAAVEDGGLWLRSVAQRRQELVEQAIAETDRALRASDSLAALPATEPAQPDISPAVDSHEFGMQSRGEWPVAQPDRRWIDGELGEGAADAVLGGEVTGFTPDEGAEPPVEEEG